MRRVLWGLMIVLLVGIVTAQSSIYDLISEIYSNPVPYTAVIGKTASVEEVRQASQLIGFFGITKSNFDSQVYSSDNLIIIGVAGHNNKLPEKVNGILIKVEGNNLIVAASNEASLKKAVSLVTSYEENKKLLQDEQYSSLNLFAPVASIFSQFGLYILAAAVIVGIGVAVLKHPVGKPIQKAINPAYGQLRNYILTNTQRGYTPPQIKSALMRIGWQQNMVDEVFTEIQHEGRPKS
ncbi:MAG TPA: hypothetical protein VJH97_06055 [Candidatus Nanoarchaeia archaeon]|nr:hypothetical protein [Candidatus Nanoarchaeia archaeon]